jgi:hypothetical protein
MGLWTPQRDFTLPRAVGTSPVERRYWAGQIFTSTATSTIAFAAGNLIALPYWSGHGGVIDRLGCNVTTLGSGSSIRCSIYDNTSDGNLYPNNLILDGGSISSASTGVKEWTTGGISLPANQLLWFTYEASATVPTVTAIATAALWAILGSSNTYGSSLGIGWTVAHTFGASPSTFPAGGSVVGTGAAPPAIGIRYSA